MFKRTLPRVALGGATITALLTAALFMPLVAEAAPRRIICNEAEGCHEMCQQQLPNGDTAYYRHGTVITMRDGQTGEEIEFKCVDGNWEVNKAFQLPKFNGLAIIGNIGVGSLAGFSGEVTGEQCNDSPEPVCEDVSYSVGPPRPAIGCDPNQVACP